MHGDLDFDTPLAEVGAVEDMLQAQHVVYGGSPSGASSPYAVAETQDPGRTDIFLGVVD
jgi:hypothetical protein